MAEDTDGEELSLADVARSTGVKAATLRRWASTGLIPGFDGTWTRGSLNHARIVARLRTRGHALQSIREASERGRLAFAFTEDLFPPDVRAYTLEEAARELKMEAALIRRIHQAAGLSKQDELTEDDVQLLRYINAALSAGFPLVAFLQLVRVYGHPPAQIADAEVRLFHLYVHEPLMRPGVPVVVMAEA